MKDVQSIESIELMIHGLIAKTFPACMSEKKYGGHLYTIPGQEGHFCGVFSFESHVTIEFPYGYKMKDPKNILLGQGKFRRHIKIREGVPLDQEVLKKYLKASEKLLSKNMG